MVSLVGAFGPTLNLVNIGAALNKGLTLRMNQASVRRYLPRCIEHIQAGHIRPKEVISHRVPLADVAERIRRGYGLSKPIARITSAPSRMATSTGSGSEAQPSSSQRPSTCHGFQM